MIILLLNGEVSTIRNDVTVGCRRRCTTGRVIAGRLQSIAELICVTRLWVVVFHTRGELIAVRRFGFPRSSRVGFV